MAKKSMKSFLVTFEGLEGSGKSTQMALLTKFLQEQKVSVKVFRDPGSTVIGEKIRSILLDKRNVQMNIWTELLLYLAARSQLIHERLKPALAQYEVVLCDRFFDSTLAYQGYASGLSVPRVQSLIRFFSFGIIPHLTFFLDAQPRVALGRIQEKDRMESRPLVFHEQIRQAYHTICKADPKRIFYIRPLGKEEAFVVLRDIFIQRWKKHKLSV